MAKFEKSFRGEFAQVLKLCERAVLDNSSSATLEDKSDWTNGDTAVSVRVFERYSWFGSNRVSLHLTLVGNGDMLFLTAITAGGSQAVFFKVNTFGEEAFLETLVPAVEGYIHNNGVGR